MYISSSEFGFKSTVVLSKFALEHNPATCLLES